MLYFVVSIKVDRSGHADPGQLGVSGSVFGLGGKWGCPVCMRSVFEG